MKRKAKNMNLPKIGALALPAALTLSALAQQATFEGLGDLPGEPFRSFAYGVSDDGGFAVGRAHDDGGQPAFIWSADAGMTGLPNPGPIPGADAFDCADGGRIVVGRGYMEGGVTEPVRWVDRVAQRLGWLEGGDRGEASAVSADGSVCVGMSNHYHNGEGPIQAPFRWQNDTMTNLGTLAQGGPRGGGARGVSADGSIVVGWSVNDDFVAQAFRWTPQGGMTGLAMPPGQKFGGEAADVSDDGSVIVGSARSDPNTPSILRWVNGELIVLGTGRALAASADGAVMVGFVGPLGSAAAMIWDEAHGVRALQSVLESDYGLDLTGWNLQTASDVSADGRVVVGWGVNPGGDWEAWRVVLPCRDTDGDGLCDDWEINGIPYTDANGEEQRYLLDIDGDGANDCDPNVPDIFVEIDAMTGLAPGGAAIGRVEAAFAASNVRLHVDLDETNLTVFGWTLDDTNSNDVPDWPTEFDALKLTAVSGTPLRGFFGTAAERNDPEAAAIRDAKAQAFRYCIFGEELDPGDASSGLGEGPGNDFMVTLGNWAGGGTSDQRAGTFMHELGHTLGLRHGGSDDTNYKPNYYSVMNYLWQMPQYWNVPGSWPLDANRRGYSYFAIVSLDEAALDECIPLVGSTNPLAGVRFVHNTHDDPDEPPVILPARFGDPINWDGGDCDFGVSVDVNRVLPENDPSPGESLPGHDDWDALVFGFRDLPAFAEGVHNPESGDGLHELSFEMHQELQQILPPYCHGDINDDRVVDFGDLIEVLSAWGPCPDGCRADIEPIGFIDGAVTIDDLLAILSAWGPCE